MKSITKKSLLLLLVNSLLFACTTQNNIPIQANKNNEINSNYSTVGNVKFNFDFPAKSNTNNPELKKAFGVKAIEVGKINRVKVRVESATTSYVIERNVELVPGGVEATLSLPLDKLYTITVQGLNDTESVSGAEIKGYFSLMSSSIVSNVTVNQVTTPVAKIIEGLKVKIIASTLANNKTSNNALPASSPSIVPISGTTQKSPDPVVSGSPTTANPSGSASPDNIPNAVPTPSLFPSFAPSPTPVDLTKVLVTPEGQFRLANIDTAALYEVVNRARGAAHPSLINVDSFVNSIFINQSVPVEVPENPLLKTGTIKGKISGLKYNEVAVVTVNDPASRQTIVVTPSQISLSTDTTIDPDKISPDINYEVDNITPGSWNVTIVSSGYTSATTTDKGTPVKSDTVSSFDFKLLAAQWPKTPINVSGSLGTSDQASLALDEVGNIHTVWRQDGFDTNSDSGVIYYSRWNGISWTSQGFNISQYNNSGLKGSRDPSVAVGLDRLPQIVWSAKNDAGVRQIYFAQFDGTTWKSPTSILGSDSGVTPSISVDKTNGFLYATWENNGKIYLSEYNKVTWSSPTVVGSGTVPKTKIGTDSIVHIVWKTSSQSLQYANWRSGKGLSSVENIPMNSLGNDTESSIDTAVDRFNRLHLVWRNDIYIQYSLRSNVSWSQPEIVNQLPTAFLSAKSGASISVAPTGIVNIAWVSTTKDNKEVIRFRRKLSDGFKQPFTKILDSTEPVKVNNGTVTATPTTTTATEIKRSENIDGYEDIPFSNTASIAGNPLILADYKGNIHVIWSSKGANGSDADLLHSIKGNVEVTK